MRDMLLKTRDIFIVSTGHDLFKAALIDLCVAKLMHFISVKEVVFL